MYVILSILLIGMGTLMLFRPQIWYELAEGWKHSGNSEPTGSYIFSTRFGGIMCALVGFAYLVVKIFV